MKKIWFRRKTYGWGWTPSTIEGWLVMLGYMISIGVLLYVVNIYNLSSALLTVLFLVLTIILIIITALNGETPRWQWGNKDKKDR